MAVVRMFQPRFAAVGAYARAGAAGVAARENLDQSLGRTQQFNLAQQQMGLQREGLYQTLAARLADSRNQAATAAAHLKARQDEAEANRQHSTEMQQAGFSQAATMADANATREMEMRTQLANAEVENRKVQYDYELTRQGEIANAKANEALRVVQEEHRAGRLNDDDLAAARMAIEADRNGIEKMPVPKKKIPTVKGELESRQYTDEHGNTYLMQPDGQIDFRPKVPDKPPVTFGDYVQARTLITQQLTKITKDVQGNEIEVPPKPEEVQQHLNAMMQGYNAMAPKPGPTAPPPIPGAPPMAQPPAAPSVAPSQPPVVAKNGNVVIKPATDLTSEQAESMLKALEEFSRKPPEQITANDRMTARFFARKLGIPEQ